MCVYKVVCLCVCAYIYTYEYRLYIGLYSFTVYMSTECIYIIYIYGALFMLCGQGLFMLCIYMYSSTSIGSKNDTAVLTNRYIP